MAHPSEPIPLFSPTQVASTSNEQVLHSIFSPTLQGGVTSFNNIKKSKVDDKDKELKKRERIARAAKQIKPKTPACKKNRPSVSFVDTTHHAPGEQETPSPLASTEFHSPIGQNSAPFIPATLSKPVLKTPANLAKSAFRSPHSHEFKSPFSTISALTTTSACSFKSLSIDMLSFDYVCNCDSPQELQQIVDTLSADGSKQHYPSLLKRAKQQLETLKHESPNNPSVQFLAHAYEVPKDGTLYISSTRDESSLALSLSSSMLMDDDDDESAHNDVPTAATTVNAPHSILKKSDSVYRMALRDVETKQRFGKAQAAAAYATDKVEGSIEDEASHNNKALSNGLDSDVQRELLVVREEKKKAESKVATLEKAVLSSSSHAREANVALASVREEARQLQILLDNERAASQSQIKEARSIERGLREKIQVISAQLQQCKEQSADIIKSAESRFRRQAEKDATKRHEAVRELQQSLESTNMTVHAMQEERNSVFRSIHEALGKPTDGVERLSAMERKATVDSVASKLISSRAATKALSKSLTEAELDRKSAIKARDAAKKQLDTLTSQCRRLEQQNELLRKQVDELIDELESSKAYVDYLLERKYQDDEWQAKEKEYKAVISNLKAQVISNEASVSLALYRKAVDEARARAVECQDKRLELNSMARKLHDLEARLEDRKLKVQTTGPSPPEQTRHNLRSNMRKVTPTSIAKDDKENPKTPTPAGKGGKNARPPPPPLTPRMSALREAGGRKGLCAKLKQMRRSPLVSKN